MSEYAKTECESPLVASDVIRVIRAELESLRDWADEQTDNGFADQVRQWAMSKLDRLNESEAGRG